MTTATLASASSSDARSAAPDDRRVALMARGDRSTLAEFYETRAAAVLAYCSRICAPQLTEDAVEAAFAELFEAVRRGEVEHDGELDSRLRRAVRFAAAAHMSSSVSDGAAGGAPLGRLLERFAEGTRCELVPHLLAAGAEGELIAGDAQSVRRHIARCRECAATATRLADAERTLDLLLPATSPREGNGGGALPARPLRQPAPATDQRPAAADPKRSPGRAVVKPSPAAREQPSAPRAHENGRASARETSRVQPSGRNPPATVARPSPAANGHVPARREPTMPAWERPVARRPDRRDASRRSEPVVPPRPQPVERPPGNGDAGTPRPTRADAVGRAARERPVPVQPSDPAAERRASGARRAARLATTAWHDPEHREGARGAPRRTERPPGERPPSAPTQSTRSGEGGPPPATGVSSRPAAPRRSSSDPRQPGRAPIQPEPRSAARQQRRTANRSAGGAPITPPREPAALRLVVTPGRRQAASSDRASIASVTGATPAPRPQPFSSRAPDAVRVRAGATALRPQADASGTSDPSRARAADRARRPPSGPPLAQAEQTEASSSAESADGTRPKLRLGPKGRKRLAIVLAILGVLLIAEAAVSVLWEEPITSYLAGLAQDDLRSQLRRLEHQPSRLGAAEQRSLATIAGEQARVDARLALLAGDIAKRTRPGRALGSISAPAIGVDFVFVQGTGGANLRKGPGHYPQTALPGQQGTVGIAGHRTTYLAPFRDIDQLHRGDRIVVTMPYGRFTYSVEGHRIVPAGRTDAFRDVGRPQLVLSACHPLYSASHRILVTARLVARQPLGAGVVGAAAATAAAGSAGAAQRAQQLQALGERVLGLDDSGPDVRELQYLLGVPASGHFGYETESAVEGFERGHGLRPDGIVDAALKQLLARRAHPPLTPPTPPTPPPVAPAATASGGPSSSGPASASGAATTNGAR